jgi:putative ABC transport system permease protein
LVLTDRLADKLGLRIGDPVQVLIQEGRPRTVVLTVAATVSEMMGLNAYMERSALNRLLGEGDVASGFNVSLDPGREVDFLRATRACPAWPAASARPACCATWRRSAPATCAS